MCCYGVINDNNNLVTNIVALAVALTLMRDSTPVPTGVIAAASSWKPRSLVTAWMDGRLPDAGLVGWMELCFNYPVVCCSPSLSYYSQLPHRPVLCLYIGMSGGIL